MGDLAGWPASWKPLTGGDKQRAVVISGDKTVAYDKVMAVMRELQQRGYARFGLLVKTGRKR